MLRQCQSAKTKRFSKCFIESRNSEYNKSMPSREMTVISVPERQWMNPLYRWRDLEKKISISCFTALSGRERISILWNVFVSPRTMWDSTVNLSFISSLTRCFSRNSGGSSGLSVVTTTEILCTKFGTLDAFLMFSFYHLTPASKCQLTYVNRMSIT